LLAKPTQLNINLSSDRFAMFNKQRDITHAQTRHDFGVTITVARQQSKTVSKLSFLTAVHTAKGIAKQEGISEIFVCTATTPSPTPTIPHPPAGHTSPA
jgi:hypothetical protein